MSRKLKDKSRSRARSRLQRNFETMQREGQGVWQFFLVHQHEATVILAVALAGEPRARHLLRVVSLAAHQLRTPGPAPLCLLCDHVFPRDRDEVLPPAFAGVYAAVDAPAAVVMNRLCHRCAAIPQPELGERVLAFYRTNGMPDLRLLQITGKAGHA